VAISTALLMRKFDYKPRPLLDRCILQNTWKYSAGNYIADTLNILPTAIIPIIIINSLGTAQMAYYYIVLMIANAVEVIPSSITRSLFSEGSAEEHSIHRNVKRSIRLIALMLIPVATTLLFIGDTLLTLFGKSFSDEGFAFLQLMVVDSIIIGVYYVYDALFRLSMNVRAIIIRNLCYAGSVIALSYALIPYGLVGIGVAWIVSTSLAGLLSYILFKRSSI
jgi:O-antigen/teichoic acid export membrane protein